MNSTKEETDLGQLQADFHRAIDAWRNADFGDWRELWLRPECALLEYAKAKRCEFEWSDGVALVRLRRFDHIQSARRIDPDSDGQTRHPDAKQAALLMQGLVNGVFAAVEISQMKGNGPSGDCLRYAGSCIDAYLSRR